MGEVTLTAGAQDLAQQYGVDMNTVSSQVEGSVRWNKANMQDYLIATGLMKPEEKTNAEEPAENQLEPAQTALGDSASAEVIHAAPTGAVSTEGTDSLLSDMMLTDSAPAAAISDGPAVLPGDAAFENGFDELFDDMAAASGPSPVSGGAEARPFFDGTLDVTTQSKVDAAIESYAKAPVGANVSIPWEQRYLAVALEKTGNWAIIGNTYDKTTLSYSLSCAKVK